MILAAGKGTRMGSLTDVLPKPLLKIGGRTIIDRILDRLIDANIKHVVINLNHGATKLRDHLSSRHDLSINFSDESTRLLDTGGGINKALTLIGGKPFFAINGDVLWFDHSNNSLHELAMRFSATHMAALLLLQPTVGAIGYQGIGDFMMKADGQIVRRPEREVAPFIHTGIQILKPDLFVNCPEGPFSLNQIYDKAAAINKLFGLRLEGKWMELNRPEGLVAATNALSAW